MKYIVIYFCLGVFSKNICFISDFDGTAKQKSMHINTRRF